MTWRHLLWFSCLVPVFAQVSIVREGDHISVDVDHKPFTALYITGPETTKPYLHPLRSASGVIVTRQYPMETIVGERQNEKHQRGVWFSHGDVNGFDFWDNEASYHRPRLGHIVLDRVVGLKGGKRSGTIDAAFRWLDTSGKPLLGETRTMTFYSEPDLRIIDFDITLQAIENVTFNDTKEGTFGIRVAAWLEEPMPDSPETPKRAGRIVNSDGLEREKNCWGKRANWVDYFGDVNGETLGIALFDHPGNPRHPTYWHVRGYGLLAANIFGKRAFERDPALNGAMTLAPGEKMRFRYRVIVHLGDSKSAKIGDLYHKYELVP
jgi:Methane oxygenase PmoA